MPTTRLPTRSEWIEVDWEGAEEMGFELPRFNFVTAEDLTKERGRDGQVARSLPRVRDQAADTG